MRKSNALHKMLLSSELVDIRTGYYTDEYFNRASWVLQHETMNPEVVMQFFAKKSGIVAGIEEVRQILHYNSGFEWYSTWEGEDLRPHKPVLYLKGKYRDFAHLETPILGILARRSLVATNTKKVMEAANGKPVIFMPARHDDFRVQPGDGYAARVGGVTSVTTHANCSWIDDAPVGTMPHSLIACFRGDVAQATTAFHRAMSTLNPDKKIKTISLVDYNNNCVIDAVKVAEAMERSFGRGKLFAVRLDTSESMTDDLLQEDEKLMAESLSGVHPSLVSKVRYALDVVGYPEVGIVVSGGFTPEKIRRFERWDVPVDGYGVGSSILGHSSSEELYSGLDFTADIVAVDGEPEAKEGRRYVHNEDLLGSNFLVR